MENNVFEPQRELAREFATKYTSVDISGSQGFISNDSGPIPYVDCRGYNLIKIVVHSITSGISFKVRASASDSYLDDIDFISLDKGCVTSDIDHAGTYLIDVSKLCKLGFYRNEEIAAGTITFDILRCCETLDVLPKVLQLATGIVNITSNSNTVLFGNTAIDISNYRFLAFRVKTVPLDGETEYKNGSVEIKTEFICKGAEHSSYIASGIKTAFVMQNNYIAISDDWTMIVAPFVKVYAKSLNSTAPTVENPEKYEVTLYGIR